MTFLATVVAYFAIRDLGASVQAGFGIGSRIAQVILLPGLAIAFAAGPIAGQNFTANNPDRVRQTFRTAALISVAVLAASTIAVQLWPYVLPKMFTSNDSAIIAASLFLRVMSWGFIAQGLIYTCANMFLGLGNMIPSMLSSSARFVVFTIPTASSKTDINQARIARGPIMTILTMERTTMYNDLWTIAEAKAKLSKVIERAQKKGTQVITRNGRRAVVVVDAEEWERRTKRSGNLAEFFAASPLRCSGLKLRRVKDRMPD